MGGSDVCPESYGEQALRPEWNGDRIRDDYEIALLRAFMERASRYSACAAAPRSSTSRSAARSTRTSRRSCPGALNHRDWDIYADNAHATSIVAGSGLARLYPGLALTKTNSVHHQAAKDVGRDLVVEAWSEPDRVVEALRWTGPSYVFGVQWHPEFHTHGARVVHRRYADPRRLPGARQALKATHRENTQSRDQHRHCRRRRRQRRRRARQSMRRARAAQPAWAAVPMKQRLDAIRKFRDRIAERLEELAQTLTREVGKPIKQSRNELNGLLGRIDFFLAEAARVLRDEKVFADAKQKLEERISHEPLGVIANISAWNYPYFVGGNVFVPRCSPATRCCTSRRNSRR